MPELSYNAGNTLHRLESYERAVAETQRALPPTDTELGANTYYALGNHLLALEELEQAYEAYRSSLLLDPDDEDAKHNLELTLARLLAQQQQEQQQQPGEGESGEGEEGAARRTSTRYRRSAAAASAPAGQPRSAQHASRPSIRPARCRRP